MATTSFGRKTGFGQQAIDNLIRWIGLNSVSDRSNDPINDDISEVLSAAGFIVDQQRYVDRLGVPKSNVIARRDPIAAPKTDDPSGGGLAYFCHTDVVPADRWTGPGGDPFTAVCRDQRIYGRGSCDMKGSLAAMVAAAVAVPQRVQSKPLWIVCTADEETGFSGVREFVQRSPAYQTLMHTQPIAIIGEPTSLKVMFAHKGIAVYRFSATGVAAHSSTDLGVNATRALLPVLTELDRLADETLSNPDLQNKAFSPSHLSWNFGVRSPGGAVNIVPDHCEAWLCFRIMPDVDHQPLLVRLREVADRNGVEMRQTTRGEPSYVNPDATSVTEACRITGSEAGTVCFGTDGGEMPGLNQRIVIGPGSIDQAHTENEWIAMDQLQSAAMVYEKMIRRWCV